MLKQQVNRQGGRCRFAIVPVGLALALLAAGCSEGTTSRGTGSQGHRLSFSVPEPVATTVDLGGGSLSTKVAEVAGRLRAAGATVSSTDAGAGVVLAESGDGGLVDCGLVTQTLDRERATFPGNAPTAVVYDFSQPGDIVMRQVSTATRIEVRIAPGPSNAATLRQVHEVSIGHTTADGSQTLWSQTETFDGASVARFTDGTSCTSSARLRQIVGG